MISSAKGGGDRSGKYWRHRDACGCGCGWLDPGIGEMVQVDSVGQSDGREEVDREIAWAYVRLVDGWWCGESGKKGLGRWARTAKRRRSKDGGEEGNVRGSWMITT